MGIAGSVGCIRATRKPKLPRAASTLEERFHWLILSLNFPAPKREFRFDSIRRWRFDFAWPDQKIAVECEGGVWNGGRHTRGSGFTADCEKYNAATLAGWRVFRVTADMVKNRQAISILERAFA